MYQPLRHLAVLMSTLVILLSACSNDGGASDVDVSAQVQALKNPDSMTRQNAAVELAKAGPAAASAVPALTEALKDRDPLVRRLAAYALMEIGPEGASSAIPAVKQLLADPDRDVVFQAVNTLQELDPTFDAKVQNVQSGTAIQSGGNN